MGVGIQSLGKNPHILPVLLVAGKQPPGLWTSCSSLSYHTVCSLWQGSSPKTCTFSLVSLNVRTSWVGMLFLHLTEAFTGSAWQRLHTREKKSLRLFCLVVPKYQFPQSKWEKQGLHQEPLRANFNYILLCRHFISQTKDDSCVLPAHSLSWSFTGL